MRKKLLRFEEALNSGKLYKRRNWKKWCFTQTEWMSVVGPDKFVVDYETGEDVKMIDKDYSSWDWITKEDPVNKLRKRLEKKKAEMDAIYVKLMKIPRIKRERYSNEIR